MSPSHASEAWGARWQALREGKTGGLWNQAAVVAGVLILFMALALLYGAKAGSSRSERESQDDPVAPFLTELHHLTREVVHRVTRLTDEQQLSRGLERLDELMTGVKTRRSRRRAEDGQWRL